MDEFGVLDGGFRSVRASFSEHVYGHVNSDSETGWADFECGLEDIEAGAGAKIKDGFSLKKGQSRGFIT